MSKAGLSESEIRLISVEAGVDPRTLRKALKGDRVRPMALDRIRTALAARGRENAIALSWSASAMLAPPSTADQMASAIATAVAAAIAPLIAEVAELRRALGKKGGSSR